MTRAIYLLSITDAVHWTLWVIAMCSAGTALVFAAETGQECQAKRRRIALVFLTVALAAAFLGAATPERSTIIDARNTCEQVLRECAP